MSTQKQIARARQALRNDAEKTDLKSLAFRGEPGEYLAFFSPYVGVGDPRHDVDEDLVDPHGLCGFLEPELAEFRRVLRTRELCLIVDSEGLLIEKALCDV